jgi:hypothetical protein
MSRFDRYKGGDLPELIKLGEDESWTGRLVGDREQPTKDADGVEKVLVILDLIDLKTGQERSFRSGAWRWTDALALADPQNGDVIRISRGRNIGQSHDYGLEILESAAEKVAKSDVPSDLPAAGSMPASDDIPFGVSAA